MLALQKTRAAAGVELVQLRGSFRPPESDWPRALALMAELGEALAPMVSHVLPA